MFNPEPIERDKYGLWLHSILANSTEEVPIPLLPEAAGMEFSFVSFEEDAPQKLIARYFDVRAYPPPLTEWNPKPPTEDAGWFLIGIYDTEDGPHACFTKPITTQKENADER